MNKEYSAGGVIFRKEDDTILFLIIYSQRNKLWGFPKGHIEPKETEKQAALREITEETGVQDLKIIDGFREEDIYAAISNRGEFNGQKIKKHSIYFLIQTQNKSIEVDGEEISDYKWLEFQEALKVFDFESVKKILKMANLFLLEMQDEITPGDTISEDNIDDDIETLEMLDFFDDDFI